MKRFAFAAALTAGIVIYGCGYGKVACQIIDTAADACVVLRYLSPDGEEHEVRVPRSELQHFAQREAARQAVLAADAGADAQ